MTADSFAPEDGLDRFVPISYAKPAEVRASAIARLAAGWHDTPSDPATSRRAGTVRGSVALVS